MPVHRLSPRRMVQAHEQQQGEAIVISPVNILAGRVLLHCAARLQPQICPPPLVLELCLFFPHENYMRNLTQTVVYAPDFACMGWVKAGADAHVEMLPHHFQFSELQILFSTFFFFFKPVL